MARYPEVVVDAAGPGGNIFFIVGAARRGMRDAGATKAEIDLLTQEVQATQSYKQALAVVRSWVTIDNDPEGE